MKKLTVPIGIFILAVLAGVAIMVLPGKSQAPTDQSQSATSTPIEGANIIE